LGHKDLLVHRGQRVTLVQREPQELPVLLDPKGRKVTRVPSAQLGSRVPQAQPVLRDLSDQQGPPGRLDLKVPLDLLVRLEGSMADRSF
jgi:hypothetical protein